MQLNFFLRSLKASVLLLSGLCFFSMHAVAQSGTPPVASGPTVKIYYGNMIDMATVPLVAVTEECYQVSVSGNKVWFPKSALGYRTEFPGNPVGLDYNARRFTPCGVAAAPVPPVAKWTAPASVCLNASPAPTSALITFGGSAQPVTVKVEQIVPKCIRLNYSGNPMWTTSNEAGGVGCVGNTVQIDYTKASLAFNGIRTSTPPAACADTVTPPPSGTPPVASGPTVKIYYGNMIDMATVPLVAVTEECYQVSVSGNKVWFPKSALGYRTEFPGNPVGLDYNARRFTPCGVAPAPIPPVAKWTAPASVCLNASPAPTSALITFGGSAQPVTVKVEQIVPKCIRLNYSGNPMWTTSNEAGGVGCVGSTVQIDYTKASLAFNGIKTSTPPAACQ